MTADAQDGWKTAEEKANDIAQARALREQARAGGLRFDAYLPPALADWLLDLIERGVFADPSEAVFVILGEHRDLEPHGELRRELLKRTLTIAADDPRRAIPAEEVLDDLRRLSIASRPEPAIWRRSVKESSIVELPGLSEP
jgi:Arc/MetJ-type ribon-helix-helix transcriptional regulator